MLLIVLRFLYLGICAGVIAAYINGATSVNSAYVLGTGGEPRVPPFVTDYPVLTFCVMLVITQLATLVDVLIPKKRIQVISAVYFGLIVGVVLAYSLVEALRHAIPADSPFHPIAVMFPLLMIPFICVTLILQTQDDFRFVIPYVEFSRELKGTRPLVVDSSALIDGRIADVVDTEILASRLVIPSFVLDEIQEIADSHDKTRRLRGRRGLEVLERLQSSDHVEVTVHDDRSGERGRSVDQRVVSLAQELGGGVITNDFSLNKIASVQGITVINLNDVANALKPRYIPGEQLQIRIMKEGEATGQGVGYLDDGTMVVCENANQMIGERLTVTVTSVLQKSEGRMIFGRPTEELERVGSRN